MIDTTQFMEFMWKNSSWIILSGVGGFVHYIYKVSRWEKFFFTRLVINIILAWWVWFLLSEFGLSAFFISIWGFCTKTILELIEEKWGKIITEILIKKP